MTFGERVMTTLQGKRPDRTPAFPLDWDWAVRQEGFTVSEIIGDAAFRS